MKLYGMEYPFGKFSAPAHSQSKENQKVLDLEQALLNKTYNVSMLSTSFSYFIKNSVPYKLQRITLTPSQSKLGQYVISFKATQLL